MISPLLSGILVVWVGAGVKSTHGYDGLGYLDNPQYNTELSKLVGASAFDLRLTVDHREWSTREIIRVTQEKVVDSDTIAITWDPDSRFLWMAVGSNIPIFNSTYLVNKGPYSTYSGILATGNSKFESGDFVGAFVDIVSTINRVLGTAEAESAAKSAEEAKKYLKAKYQEDKAAKANNDDMAVLIGIIGAIFGTALIINCLMRIITPKPKKQKPTWDFLNEMVDKLEKEVLNLGKDIK